MCQKNLFLIKKDINPSFVISIFKENNWKVDYADDFLEDYSDYYTYFTDNWRESDSIIAHQYSKGVIASKYYKFKPYQIDEFIQLKNIITSILKITDEFGIFPYFQSEDPIKCNGTKQTRLNDLDEYLISNLNYDEILFINYYDR